MPRRLYAILLRLSICSLAPLCCAPLQVCAHGAYHEELQRINEQLNAAPDDGALWFQRGWLSFLHGDWRGSLIDMEKAERLLPGRFPFDFVRGQALMAVGQLESARTVLGDFITANPEHGPASAMRARVLAKMNLHEEAIKDYLAALTKKPEPEPDLYQETAEALAAQGRKDEAAQVLETGITKLGNIPSLVLKALDLEISTRRFDEALLRVNAMQQSAPRSEPWMAKRASVLAQAGRLDASRNAWTVLREHIAALPNLERGSAAMSALSEQARQALAALNGTQSVPDAVAQAPSVQVTKVDATAMFPSRSALGPGSNYEEELDRMDHLILQQPANAEYRFQRGELNLLDRKWQWASQDCEEAERLAPGRFPVDRLRAKILTGEGRLAEAQAAAGKFIAAHPNDGPCYAVRARIAMQAGQPAAALADYRLALEHTPTPDCNLFLETAHAMLESGRREEALGVLQKALQVHKDEPSIVTQTLELETTMGAFDAALACVETMRKTSPQPEPWMARKAMLLAQAGHADESRAAWLALQTHLAALPNLKRGTPAMSLLASQARKALATPAQTVSQTVPPDLH